MMMRNKYNPDVGFQFIRPTYIQLHKPFAKAYNLLNYYRKI